MPFPILVITITARVPPPSNTVPAFTMTPPVSLYTSTIYKKPLFHNPTTLPPLTTSGFQKAPITTTAFSEPEEYGRFLKPIHPLGKGSASNCPCLRLCLAIAPPGLNENDGPSLTLSGL